MDKSLIALTLFFISLGYIMVVGSLMIVYDFPMKDQVLFCYTPAIITVMVAVILHVYNIPKQPKIEEVVS